MAQADLTPTSPPLDDARPAPLLSRKVVLCILILLVAYIGAQLSTLWHEWRMLRRDWDRTRQSTVIGYVNINPNPSYAASPKEWVRTEGEFTYLWSGWKPGVGHGWFKIGRGQLDMDRFSGPMGRDVIQAIDWPVVEVGGGKRWDLIPWDAEVAGLMLDGMPSVYPLLLLKKVEVVNDQLDNRAVLVTFRPFVPESGAVSVYNPMLKGKRLTMGLSGYFCDQKPVLYDRGTESFWIEDGEALVAFAGELKGSRLAQLGKARLATWSDWRSEHPHSRLIVGNDRSRGVPTR